jgi:signal transduction histidine kinase/DNA-binding response OmpR family regulator
MPPAQILIVEDEPVLAQALRINLENLGYTVPAIYHTGEQSLQHVRAHAPDLVIMDVKLQGELDGVQTAECMRSFSNIPVIFITAHSDPNTVKRAISTSPFGYIVKPFQTRELHLNIELALQNRAMEQKVLDEAGRAKTLARVASKVNRTLELDKVLETVCEEVVTIFNAPGVAITLNDDRANQVVVVAATGPYGKITDATPLPIAATLFEQVWKAGGQVVQIPDLTAFKDALPVSHPLLKDVRSVVIAFLIKGESLIGSINIPVMDLPQQFNDSDLNLLAAIADLSSIAISHARLFEQVSEGRHRLQALSRQLVEVQEAERRHLANELHDQVGQMLTGLLFSLEAGKVLPDQEAKSSLAASQEIVREIIAQVRELSLNLRPSLLDDMGLQECLRWHFQRYSSQTGILVQFAENGLGEKRFPAEIEITVYRIIQEALTNIARHAQVQEAWVSIQVNGDYLNIKIEDQGLGFDPQLVEADSDSIGLGGMRERANLVGGQLEISSTPAHGTMIYAQIPTHNRLERRKHGRNRTAGR